MILPRTAFIAATVLGGCAATAPVKSPVGANGTDDTPAEETAAEDGAGEEAAAEDVVGEGAEDDAPATTPEPPAEASTPRSPFWCTNAYGDDEVSFCERTKAECEESRADLASGDDAVDHTPCEETATVACITYVVEEGLIEHCTGSEAACTSFRAFMQSQGEDVTDVSDCAPPK